MKPKKKKQEADKEEEILDWWTRFYETLRDMEDENAGKMKKLLASPGKAPAGERIPRLKVSRSSFTTG